jgi:hypothetical protein
MSRELFTLRAKNLFWRLAFAVKVGRLPARGGATPEDDLASAQAAQRLIDGWVSHLEDWCRDHPRVTS